MGNFHPISYDLLDLEYMIFSSHCFSYNFLLNLLIILGFLLLLLMAVVPFFLTPYFNRSFPKIAQLLIYNNMKINVFKKNMERAFGYCSLIVSQFSPRIKQINRLSWFFSNPSVDFYSMMEIKPIHKVITFSYLVMMTLVALTGTATVLLLIIHNSEFFAVNFPQFTMAVKDFVFCQ